MKNPKWLVSVVAVLVVSVALMLCVESDLRNDLFGAGSEMTPVPAPAWELNDVDGNRVKSSDFAGKVVILDFWATWCVTCRKEVPGFIELQRQYADRGLVIIGVSLDEEGATVVKPYMRATGINYPVVMGNEAVAADFGCVEVLPAVFIIDRAGQIVRKHLEYTEKEELEAEIKPLLQM